MTPAIAMAGEIESPRPLFAPSGRLRLTGWCAGREVRLVIGERIFTPAFRCARPDVASTVSGAPADAGFTFEVDLPAGVHWASVQSRQRPEDDWQESRRFTIASEGLPFTAAIEHPLCAGVLTESRRLSGWAVHPRSAITSLVLRYGHRELPCDYGLPRADVHSLLPAFNHADNAGFVSTLNLPAGRGALRLKATLANGTMDVVSLPITVDISVDENGGMAPPTSANLLRLPRTSVSAPSTSQTPEQPLNVLFVLHGGFASNSALHVAALARELTSHGHACTVAVSDDVAAIVHHDEPSFRGLTFTEAESDCGFPDRRGPDIIHAWTTREHVRRAAETLCKRYRAPLIVHLEDNEPELLAQTLGNSQPELAQLSDADLDRIVPPTLSHPHRSRAFIAAARGVTTIAQRLREFAPAATPCLTLWPAADERYFHSCPLPAEFRRILDRAPGETVLFYHGNVHAANAAEMRELYSAVARLNESAVPATLIRTGLDTVDFLGGDSPRLREHVLELGQIPHHRHLPPLMALADIFVQPGVPDAFNDYRFPSKLPEFFSIGRPVVLPRTNLGEHVRHGVDAYVLDRADAEGITRAVIDLRNDRELYERLSRGALEFSAKNFSWRRSAEALAKFYAELTASG